jgi:hypothetical protein
LNGSSRTTWSRCFEYSLLMLHQPVWEKIPHHAVQDSDLSFAHLPVSFLTAAARARSSLPLSAGSSSLLGALLRRCVPSSMSPSPRLPPLLSLPMGSEPPDPLWLPQIRHGSAYPRSQIGALSHPNLLLHLRSPQIPIEPAQSPIFLFLYYLGRQPCMLPCMHAEGVLVSSLAATNDQRI